MKETDWIILLTNKVTLLNNNCRVFSCIYTYIENVWNVNAVSKDGTCFDLNII